MKLENGIEKCSWKMVLMVLETWENGIENIRKWYLKHWKV